MRKGALHGEGSRSRLPGLFEICGVGMRVSGAVDAGGVESGVLTSHHFQREVVCVCVLALGVFAHESGCVAEIELCLKVAAASGVGMSEHKA